MNIDIDQALLASIQDFVSKVKQNLADKKKCLNLNITILDNPDLLSVFYLEGDKDNPSGIYLQVCTDFMSEKEIDSYDECNLRSCFDEDNCVNLYYDAELICRVIQYLSLNVLGVHSNKIKIEVSVLENGKLDDGLYIVAILLVLASGICFGGLISLFDYLDFLTMTLMAGSGVWCINRLYSSLKESNQLNYMPRMLALVLVVGFISFFLLSFIVEL